MTHRHARYLREYPERIARKRLKRRRTAPNAVTQKREDISHLREVLKDYVASRPAPEPIRAGKPTIMTKVKNLFRKPTI